MEREIKEISLCLLSQRRLKAHLTVVSKYFCVEICENGGRKGVYLRLT